MRFLSYLVTLLFASLMAACGGGGGSPGTISGPQALAVIAPAGLTQLVGTAQAFAIRGGKAPYQALSNNELVALAGVDEGTLIIGTVGVGTAVITVRDVFGATVDVPLTSAVSQPLGTTAGTAITTEMGKSQSFRVVGGAPGYAATSANPNIASASILGSTLTITGITPGTTSVLVRDGVGSTVNIAVTVTTVGNLALFSTATSPLTVPIGTVQTFSVGGGVAPYSVANGNPSVATVTLSGNTLTIQGIKAGTASVVIRDSVNNTLPAIQLTVPAPDALFTSAPSAVTIGIGSHADFTVGGGLGTKLVSTSNAAVAVGTLDSAGTTLTITGVAAGTANIQIRDKFGTTPVTIAVTVPAPAAGAAFFTDAPSAVTLANGGTATFNLSGGTTPYSAKSNNTAIATVTQPTTTTFKITGVSGGDATITLTDGAGAILSVDVHVNAGPGAVALFSTAPSAASIAINTDQTFSVGGGTAPYTFINTNPSIATVTPTFLAAAGNFTIHGLLTGQTTLTIIDAAGARLNIAVTVIAPGTTLTVLPSTLTINEAQTGPITFHISGGTTPYNVFSSNLALVTPSVVTGSTFTIPGGTCVPPAGASATLTVVDDVGATATTTINITDNDGLPCPP